MESDLECPLCTNEYSRDNVPRLLTSCGHTFCHSCLDTLIIEENNQFRLSCPEDEIVIYLKNNQITQFPKNIALIKLIDSKKTVSSSFKDDSSLEITKIQKNEDSHGNESQQEIINEIVSSEQIDQGEIFISNSQQEMPKSLEKQQLCLVHQKPLEIVCLVDMEKICSKCAIFGSHKGHEFKYIEQIEEECNIFHEDILKVYNAQEDILKQWNSINSKEILEILEVNKEKMAKEVSEKYSRVRKALKSSEDALLFKIEEACSCLEAKIKKTLKIDETLNKEYESFANTFLSVMIKLQESGAYEQKLRMLYDQTTANLLFKGKDITCKIKSKYNNLFNEIEEIINSMKVEYSDEIYEVLNRIGQVRIDELTSSYPQPKIVQAQEESLLQNDPADEQLEADQTHSDSVGLHRSQANQRFALQKPAFEARTSLKPEPKVEIRNEAGQKLREPMHFEESTIQKVERPPKKKLKSIKLPEKFQKILESLYNDSLQTLDLTNAELGDSTVLQICEFLRGTRVRTVKFIRNKLSDEAVLKIIPSLGGVATLNLSQNFLTQVSLTHLANHRNTMQSLKTVILSQNRINDRKHKEFIQRLKKMDLTVSI